MNWRSVKQRNTRQSAKKSRRERNAAALKARVEAAGGPIKLAEIKGAARRSEPPAPGGHIHERIVWTIRDRDWVLGYTDGARWQALAPFRSWRQDGNPSEGVPLTPAAGKWLGEELDRLFPPGD